MYHTLADVVHSSSYYQNQNYLVCILYFVQVCVCDLDKWTSPNFLSLTCVVLSQVLSSTHSSCDRARPLEVECVNVTQTERNTEANRCCNWQAVWGEFMCSTLFLATVCVCVVHSCPIVVQREPPI